MPLAAMTIPGFCEGETCERWFESFAAGVPSMIALFLIIYAHRTLSARLVEASKAEQPENKKLYRSLLRSVWSVALVLLVAHAGIFVWGSLKPGPAPKGYIEGAFRDFSPDRQVDLESQPERLYMRAEADGNNWHWVIRGAPPLRQETFKIASEGLNLLCSVDLTNQHNAAPRLVELKLERESNSLDAPYQMKLLPRQLNIAWPCEALRDGVPPEQPAHGAPINAFEALSFGNAEEERHGWLEQLLGVASAFAEVSGIPGVEATIASLNDDNYRTRLAARRAIAENFELFRGWANEVAWAETMYMSGDLKYGRPSYRERLGLVYALSRRDPLPRQDMFEPPDLPNEVIEFVLEQALSEDEHLRSAAKRFVISFPGADMQARLEDLFSHETNAGNGERVVWAQDLLAHFYYNQGVLITLAAREGIAGPPPEMSLGAYEHARALAAALPGDMLLEYAKIDYGTGWTNLVGVYEKLGSEFSVDAAKAAFNSLLGQVSGREKEYRYDWQIPLIREYLETENYALFNK